MAKDVQENINDIILQAIRNSQKPEKELRHGDLVMKTSNGRQVIMQAVDVGETGIDIQYIPHYCAYTGGTVLDGVVHKEDNPTLSQGSYYCLGK